MEERNEAEQLISQANQALRERGKGPKPETAQGIEGGDGRGVQVHRPAQARQSDEGQLSELRGAAARLSDLPALAALGGDRS